jgi:hypothetical protein
MTATAKTTKRIDDLHFDHQLWLSETKFFRDELAIYQNRLSEVASKYTVSDVLKQIEHFQNQFIIQKNELDIITHLTNEHEQWLTNYAKAHPVAIDHVEFANHVVLEDKMVMFKKLYTELKHDFLKFLSANM